MNILRKLFARRGKINYVTAVLIIMFIMYCYYNHDQPYYQPKNTEVGSDELIIKSAQDLESLAQSVPQLPIEQLILNQYSSKKTYNDRKNSCATVPPSLWEITFNNYYWQIFTTKNGANIYLFGAYYDDRFVPKRTAFVRLSAMVDRVQLPPVYCQLWFNDRNMQFLTPATFHPLWFREWGNFKDGELLPHLIICQIPPKMGSNVPNSVSLVDRTCQNATNNLNVFRRKENAKKKQAFAVCVKGLAFRHLDFSLRLVEWIELLKILGVSKIHFYEIVIHPNVAKVLSYYEEKGTVEVTKLSLPGNQLNFPELIEMYHQAAVVRKRQNEVIPYNDCFYRNFHSYDFIALLDVDEIILPTHPKLFTWKDMMSSLKNQDKDAICAPNTYFFDKWETADNRIPRHLHMLRHVVRSVNYSAPEFYVKCFHNTSSVISVHNHFPLACGRNRESECHYYTVNPEIAQLQHYRKDCTLHLKNTCDELQKMTLEDTTIHRYARNLIKNTEAVLKDLGF